MLKNRVFTHLGIATNDIEATTAWYINCLGCQEIARFMVPDGTQCRFLQGNGIAYEFYQPITKIPKEQEGKIDHLAFASDDVEKDYAYAVSQGYKITTNGINFIPTFWEKGIRYFKVASSTGEQIEFCQRL
jgi:lactoylglutathione lyase